MSGTQAAGAVLVSDAVRDLPLADGLQRLLGDQPHVLAYARAPAAPGAPAPWRISEILVLAKAQPPAADEPPGPPSILALADPDPQVPRQALEAGAQQPQGNAVDPLT